MKVLEINTVAVGGSVGRITVDLAETLENAGDSCRIIYGRGKAPKNVDAVRIGSAASFGFHVLATFFKGEHGFDSKDMTEKIIAAIGEYQPDLIQLHNIHGFYLNVEQLFTYLKAADIPVVWTLHDCWSYTGHCAYYDQAGCTKWKEGCRRCPQYVTSYPYALFRDASKKNYARKKAAFTGVPELTIVTPSKWLKEQVEQSFLSDYSIAVIPNGIDRMVFYPHEGSRIRRKYGLEDKKIILGVASVWERRKGLKYFLEMKDKLPENCRIVLIGLNKNQIKKLPKDILGLPKTSKVEELAAWYSAADIYVNPTLEDNFPTTNLEALACGTPVLTFATGGSPEVIDVSCGRVVPKGDLDALVDALKDMLEYPPTQGSCELKASQYDKRDRFKDYRTLYGYMLAEHAVYEQQKAQAAKAASEAVLQGEEDGRTIDALLASEQELKAEKAPEAKEEAEAAPEAEPEAEAAAESKAETESEPKAESKAEAVPETENTSEVEAVFETEDADQIHYEELPPEEPGEED